MRSLGWALIQYDSYSYKKKRLGCRDRGKTSKGSERRWSCTSQGQRSQKKSTLLATWSQTSSPQNYEEINFCLSYPVCGTLYGSHSQIIQLFSLFFPRKLLYGTKFYPHLFVTEDGFSYSILMGELVRIAFLFSWL